MLILLIFYTTYIVLFVIIISYMFFSEIMDEHTYHELETQIREISKKVDGIIDTEKCFIRKSGMQYHIDLHATMDANISIKEGHYLSHKLQNVLKEEIPELGNVLVHIEPEE